MSCIDIIIVTFFILILILVTIILVILNDFKEEIWEVIIFPDEREDK